MFTFLSPLFLIGLISAAIPLLIHLSRSRRTKKMRFSTTRFFTDQFLRSYRMSRLKELLLLACRMALCALFAMALARPLVMPPGQSLLVGKSRSMVLVLDNSASMGYEDGGQSLLNRATGSAKQLLDELRPGDTAGIVLAGRRDAGPDVVFPELTPALGDVRQAVDSVQVAALGTDLTGAIAKAEQLLRSSSAKSKEIYVLSDLQDSGWEMDDTEKKTKHDSQVLYFFVGIRPKTPSNLAITAVQYAAARPMVGVPFSIQPHVRNHSDNLRACDVRLYVDGQKVSDRRVEKLQAQRWATPRFHHTFAKGGWHSGYVEIDDAGVAADDRRYFAFEVLDQVKVLAVNGAPSAVPRLDELFFLKTATSAGAEGESPIQMDIIAPAALGSTDLDPYPLVILANVESVPAPIVEKLESFADRGGSVLFFLGDKVAPQFYNQAFASSTRLHGGLMPGKLSALVGEPSSQEDVAFVTQASFGSLASGAGQEDEFGNLTGVTFKAHWKIEPGDSAVLMRANTGAPLLCEKPFGKGRSLVFASTCDRDWTNFPVRPAFLPFSFRLISYLAQQPLSSDGFYSTGQQVPLPISASAGVEQVLIKTPDGTLDNATSSDNAAAPLVFEGTTQPGVYALHASGKKDEPTPLFVANLESLESDLTYLDDVFARQSAKPGAAADKDSVTANLKRLLPGRPLVAYVDDPDQISEASLAARRGLPLWDILLVVVLAIALFEPWLANRISMLHYSKPQEIATASPIRGGRAARLNSREEAEPTMQPAGSVE